MENVDANFLSAMKLEEQSWKLGDEEAIITTRSGSIYHIDSEGTLTGGYLVEGRTAKLSGAVYRRGGPIRVDRITVGLCIEAVTNDKRVMVTSPVQSIESHIGR